MSQNKLIHVFRGEKRYFNPILSHFRHFRDTSTKPFCTQIVFTKPSHFEADFFLKPTNFIPVSDDHMQEQQKQHLQQQVNDNFPNSVEIIIKTIESWTSNQLKLLTRINYKYNNSYSEIREFLLDRTKEMRLKGALMLTLGDIRDVNECEISGDNNCRDSCENYYGSFECVCASNSIDLSGEIQFLPGSMCVSLQPPNNFRVFNPTPRSLFLKWRFPEIRTVDGVVSEILKGFRMNVSVELRRGESLSKIANILKIDKIPTISDVENEYDTGYDSTTLTGLVSSAKYFIRAAAVIGEITGPWSPFQNLITSNQIFTLTLNLTNVLYVPDFKYRSSHSTKKIANLMAEIIDKTFRQQNDYRGVDIENAIFVPGIQDRTFGKIRVFFESRTGWRPNTIHEHFKGPSTTTFSSPWGGI